MTDSERNDPADQLRADIEAAIDGQEKGSEPAPERSPDTHEGETAAQSTVPEPTEGDIAERARDDKGRFVAKTEEGEGEPPVKGAAEPSEEPRDAKVEPTAIDGAKTDARPPPGFSVLSKTAWDYANPSPQEWESIKADIIKREQEVDNGFKRYSGLGKFAEEAERNGRTLQDAVTDYVTVETALKQNPIGGVEYICQRMGWDPLKLVQAMATRYGGVIQAAPQAGQPAPQQSIAPPPIDPRIIAENVANVLRAEREQENINSKIELFKADPNNRYFDNMRLDMAKIVQAGLAETLEDAYEKASWLHPEIRAALINEAKSAASKEAAAAVSKSRNAAKAVGGSPPPGVTPDSRDKHKNLSLEDEIRAAADAQIGAA